MEWKTYWDAKQKVQDYEKTVKAIETGVILLQQGTLENHLDFGLWDTKYKIHQKMMKLSGKKNIWDAAATIGQKDEEWGKERNQGLRYEAYHKYNVKDEIKIEILKAITEEYEQAKADIQQYKQEEEDEEKTAKENRIKEYEIVVIENSNNMGDESWVADVKKSGNTIRIIARNVFDFGFYVYPSGKKPFETETWTEEESEAVKWGRDVAPISREVRM